MKTPARGPAWLSRFHLTPIGLISAVLFIVGLLLGATLHKGFFLLMVAGAFGPEILRQFHLLDDLDEFQRQAAARAGLRAYLTGGIFLMLVVIFQGWDQLSLSQDEVPASAVVTMMLVVYYASYCLSFWDARIAVSRILLMIGLFWLVFVFLSHATEPAALLLEALAVPGPFLLCSVLCRWWTRVVGVLLLGVSIWSVLFFNLIPVGTADAHDLFAKSLMVALLPLPLAVAGVALLAAKKPSP